MYAMYPDWGPARHRENDDQMGPSTQTAVQTPVQTGLDLRDNGGQRPDDN